MKNLSLHAFLALVFIFACTKPAPEDTPIVTPEATPEIEKDQPPTQDFSQPQGFVKDSIYLIKDEPLWFRKFGDGPVKVVQADFYQKLVDENASWGPEAEWEFSDDTHGGRVRATFNRYADQENVSLFVFAGNSNEAFEVVKTKETVIISASTHFGAPFEIHEENYTAVEKLKASNVLYIGSLENEGVEGSLQHGIYEYPHAGNAYVIEKDPVVLEQTIFVGYYKYAHDPHGFVDMHGGFAERNIGDIIFVDMIEYDNNASTSHATPKLAAFATKVLFKHPELDAKALKRKIFELTTQKEIPVRDLKGEKIVEGTKYDYTMNGYGYNSYNTLLTVKLLTDSVIDNY